MDYYSHYKFLLNYYDKDISLLITQYIYAKCIDCNDSWHDEYYECKCNDLRCKQHTHFYTVLIDGEFKCNTCFDKYWIHTSNFKRIFIKCIYCDFEAIYGFKDIICYCSEHHIFKNSIQYTYCLDDKCINKGTIQLNSSSRCINHQTDKTDKERNFNSKISIWKYVDGRMSILNINGIQCSFCNMRYININRKCKCKSYCDYCFYICVWIEGNKYVCNNCHSINNVNYIDTLNIHLKCHKDDCTNYAKYGKYGILLYCKIHAKYDKLGYKCAMTNCYKFVVYKDRCYDHIKAVVRNKIDYIIKN